MIRGKLVNLVEMDSIFVQTVREWRRNPDIYKYLFSQPFINDLQQEDWYKKVSNSTQDLYMIITDTLSVPVGLIYLNHINLRNRNAEWGYFTSQDSKMAGFALEAEYLFTIYAFDYLNLHKLYCITLEENRKVLSAHERFGYIQEGVFKEHYYLDGEYKNAVFMSLFKKDFKRNEIRKIINRIEVDI